MSGILGILGENINVQMKENKLAFAEVRFFEDNAFKQKRTQNYWELKSHFTQKTYFWFQVLEQSDHNGNCSHTQRPQLTPLNFPMIVQAYIKWSYIWVTKSRNYPFVDTLQIWNFET